MKVVTLLTSASLLLVAAACTPATEKPPQVMAEASCPDDGPRLPGTGLCQGRAINYFDPVRLAQSTGELPEGCSYVVNETLLPGQDEAILYQALSCNGKTTKLEFSAGARSASLGYGVSGFFEQVPVQGEEGSEKVRIFTLEGVADPQAMILEMAKQTTEDAAEAAACEIRPAGEGFPADAYLVDVNTAYQEANKLGPFDPVTEGPAAGVYGACGIWGITGASDFWLIRDGYAWFVSQGQDLPDFDAGSLTVFKKGADGQWGPVG
jgi:hypothetical protein